jgi:hypothetical protein
VRYGVGSLQPILVQIWLFAVVLEAFSSSPSLFVVHGGVGLPVGGPAVVWWWKWCWLLAVFCCSPQVQVVVVGFR